MICKYVSGTGEEFILNDSYEVNIKECQPYFSKWNVEGNDAQFGIVPTSLSKDAISLPITLKFRGTITEMKNNLESFFEMCEKDILAFNEDGKTQGKLYLGDYDDNGKFVGGYLAGWVNERETAPVKEWYGYSQTINFIAPYPFWIYPLTKEFIKDDSGSESGLFLDYDYDYPYDFSFAEAGVRAWDVNHYGKSDFILTIYGYCEDPRIVIDGHEYQVFTSLDNGEYLIINSKELTITKHLNSGDEVNIFNWRLKSSSVFEKIPSGHVILTWDGTFGFTLTLLTERSEPKWITG